MWEQIVAFMSREWMGITASLFVLVSFLTSNETKTRLINIVGCLFFVVQGIVGGLYSVSVMNGALVIVHIVKLVKIYNAKKVSADGTAQTELAEDTQNAAEQEQPAETPTETKE